MADTNFIQKAVEIVKRAVEADNEERYPEALSLYRSALKYFMTGLKYEKNETKKKTVRAKVGEYMTRAEQISKHIADGQQKKVVKQGAGAHKETDDEKENDKLKGALSSAIVTEKPNVKWDDVAGLEQAKALLKEAVILPIKFPQLFTGKRKPWRGILLYGPPGTGKSFLAKAVATEAGASTFLSVSSSDLVSKFQGESERLVKQLFTIAREQSPAIIFIDEVDSLCSARGEGENDAARRIKTEFLVQMQGVGNTNEGVLVLGATNTPWELDPAIRRRFEKRVYIPLPERQARMVMFKIHIGDTPNNLTDQDMLRLADQADGFSGADISIVVRDALYEPVRTCQHATHFRRVKDPQTGANLWEPCSPSAPGAKEMSLMDIKSEELKPLDVSLADFERVMMNAKPSVGPDDLTRHEEWTEQFGQEG